MKKVYVFVVCGAKEHIDTLHFSLAALQKFSQHSIVVLTDTSRNEAPIHHDRLIDIKTPEHYNHHQASIYLKTGLHQFLDKGNTYCYLDTDVVAVSADCDDIFKQRAGLINFAPDHFCLLNFSSHAVNCSCPEKWKTWNRELDELLSKYDILRNDDDLSLLEKRKRLFRQLGRIEADRKTYLKFALKLLTSPRLFQLDEDLFYHRWKRQWQDKNQNVLYKNDQNVFRLVQQHSHFVWNKIKEKWMAEGKYDVFNMQCNHLREQIFNTFGISVKEENWQHWNGGVFLFDDDSHPFLTAWHQKSLQIFNDPAWKTRDQGTLIATAWEFGLQYQALLPKRFNFIADFQNPLLMVDEKNNLVSDNLFKTSHAASFVHVFNRFGDKEWFFWKWVLNQYK